MEVEEEEEDEDGGVGPPPGQWKADAICTSSCPQIMKAWKCGQILSRNETSGRFGSRPQAINTAQASGGRKSVAAVEEDGRTGNRARQVTRVVGGDLGRSGGG